MERCPCPCPCKYFLVEKCKYGDRCRYLHAWSWSTDFSLLTPLHGHHKAITAILLPSASDELISSSEDGTLKFWNCHTGECISTRNFDSEIGCIMSDGPWLFVGLRNSIKVYNFENNTQFTLLGPAGLVYALAAHHDMLFAGTQGVLALQGTIDATGQSVLCCSVNDHTVGLYNLPSFERRGRIFAKKEVRALQTGPSALFFTGDGTGDLKVWKWSTDKGCNMQC
ncbi:zinc finger WD40 repeat protein 1 [Rhynchospora pubera]|uniref:Zinc finger WD40 repeat protein 1 n=1 Tax=Rhynchospora pubera TaxID=906938 RepID=A0AAV8D7Y3_9POAL|nr:zinc finger WD40 repeat protein 1 [Rhynchospora pubera]